MTEPSPHSPKPFRILSIDGGGIRGVFPAHILTCISTRLGIVDIQDHFNMIAGTSTGAIVAAGIAVGLHPDSIGELYKKSGHKIFTERKSWLPRKYRPAINCLYNNTFLREILQETFGDIKLGEIKKPLLLPATDIGLGCVHVFKSAYSEGFTRDPEVPLVEAVMASCSAPTFFEPVKVQEYLLADGGLWANNPSLAAVIDAQYRLRIDAQDIRILSLGTGHAKSSYGVNTNRKWGLFNGWKGREFINFIMSLQAQSVQNYLQLLLKPHQILRINFESDLPLPLDDVTAIDDLISRADKEFTYRSSAIRKFLDI